MSLPVKRYATALFRAAQEAGSVDAVAADLDALGEALRDSDLAAVLTNPAVRGDLRRRTLEGLTKGRHELVQNLVAVLLQRRRAPVLIDLAQAFLELVWQDRNELHGTVETSRPLEELEVRKLEKQAGQLTGRKVFLSVVHHSELLGGLRLRLGNTLYDGSAQGALNQLHKRLLQASAR